MQPRETLFRPTRQESKADSTDRAAREIVDAEGAAHREKTGRLRSARLASEAATRAVPPAPGRKPAKKSVAGAMRKASAGQ